MLLYVLACRPHVISVLWWRPKYWWVYFCLTKYGGGMPDNTSGYLNEDSKEIKLALISAEAEIRKQKIATKSALLVATVSAIGGLAIALAPKIIKDDPPVAPVAPVAPVVTPSANAASDCESGVVQQEPALAASIDPWQRSVDACEAKALKAVVAVGGVVGSSKGDGVSGTVDGNSLVILCSGGVFSMAIAGADNEKTELAAGRIRNFMSK